MPYVYPEAIQLVGLDKAQSAERGARANQTVLLVLHKEDRRMVLHADVLVVATSTENGGWAQLHHRADDYASVGPEVEGVEGYGVGNWDFRELIAMHLSD